MNGIWLRTKKSLVLIEGCVQRHSPRRNPGYLLSVTPPGLDAQGPLLDDKSGKGSGFPGPQMQSTRLRSDVMQKLYLPPSVTLLESCSCDWYILQHFPLRKLGDSRNLCPSGCQRLSGGDPVWGRIVGVKARQICSRKKICFAGFLVCFEFQAVATHESFCCTNNAGVFFWPLTSWQRSASGNVGLTSC